MISYKCYILSIKISMHCKHRNFSKTTEVPDLIATEILAFLSKSFRNKNDSDPINGMTIPI